MKFLFLALIGFSALAAVHSFSCYVCNSQKDANCAEDPEELTPVKCPDHELFCAVYRAELEDKDPVVVRSCGHIRVSPLNKMTVDPRTQKAIKLVVNNTVDLLRFHAEDNKVSEQSYNICTTDKCNSASGLTAVFGTLMAGFVAVMLANRN